MPENISQNVIEAEIVLLTKEIEEKRRMLEAQKGVIEAPKDEKELVRAVLAEKFPSSAPVQTQAPVPAPATPAVPPPTAAKKPAGGSYLDTLDEESVASVNVLLEGAFSHGLSAAISKAREQSPFILDAFHDALTDKLYDELKARKIVK
jgi:hypothetical protein